MAENLVVKYREKKINFCFWDIVDMRSCMLRRIWRQKNWSPTPRSKAACGGGVYIVKHFTISTAGIPLPWFLLCFPL